MPILVLGAILGGFAGCLMIRFGLIPAKAYINLVVIGMAAYFGAIEMAPFTAICLLTEMVGTIQQILPMLLVNVHCLHSQRSVRGTANLWRAA